MYSGEETKHLQHQTAQFLQNPQSIGVNDLPKLRSVLRFHEYRYYVQDDPLVSDYEYDMLYKKLIEIETADPTLVTPDSPSQRVGKGLTKSFPTVQHLVPMLSLENSYDAEDLRDWDRKAREASGLDLIEYCAEPKFDGASISLVYKNDNLFRGVTRGDGVEGEDITTNIKQIRSIPLSAPFSKWGIDEIEIRGEVIITRDKFKKFNDGRMEAGLPLLANPRNAASGSLRMIDPSEVGKRGLEAFLYHISDYTTTEGIKVSDEENHSKENVQQAAPFTTHSGSLELLWNLGFRSPVKEKRVLKGIDEVIAYCHEFETGRDKMPYEIDGMVIKVNDLKLQDKLGMTSHHPRWAIAFKFKARQATSKLKEIEFNVGRTGAVTPVAKIDPVHIGGVTVARISIHNEEYIKEKDLKIGDAVLVERAGDVIPQIVKSLPELRTGEEETILFPTHCPACNSQLFKEEGEAVWRCPNIECPAQTLERIIHFVSKDAMDIKHFGEANVHKFNKLGWLPDVPSIYKLDFQKIGELEGFGKKSVENLQQSIEASKQQPLHRLVYGLGIRYVGETTAKTLANAVNTIFDFTTMTEEQLLELEDIGGKVSKSVQHFFSNPQNIAILHDLEALGLQVKNEKKQTSSEKNTLQNQTFLFTGSLSKLTRSKAEEIVEQHGGKILGGISSKLNYLVVGEDAGSKLEKAKKINTIRIINEDEFLKMTRIKFVIDKLFTIFEMCLLQLKIGGSHLTIDLLHHLKIHAMNTSRRTFLKQTGAASALFLLSPKNLFSADANTLIGLQLWTVKEDAAKDLDSTLKHIADVGYNNVELFGYDKRLYFGHSVKEVKAMLDKYNLRSTSAHVAINDFLFNNNEDQLKYAIEDAKTLGHEYLTQPWFAEDKRSIDTFKMLTDKFNKAGEQCNKAGLKFAYHNHNFEFVKANGTCGYEVLLNGTQKNLVNFEMDLYWVVYAGEKPETWFHKYPGRFPMWHVKDMSKAASRESTEIGKGTIDFKQIFTHKAEAGYKTFFVEQEAFADEPPAQAIVTSFKYIKANLV